MSKFLFYLLFICAVIPAQTILTVTTNADSGAGSLREAIDNANKAAGNVIIRFKAGLVSPIALNSSLQITKPTGTLRIEGPGADKLDISGQKAYQIFYITQGTIFIASLALINGQSNQGGAIYTTESTVTVVNCTFSGNYAFLYGGAIFVNNNKATFNNCTISGNGAENGSGIGVWQTSTAILNNCTISGNAANYHGGGILTATSTLTLNNCTISGNSAQGHGGGIMSVASSTLTFNRCTISNNSSAIESGGAMSANNNNTLTFNDCTISGNSTAKYYGGGIFAEKQNTITFNNCTLAKNSAKMWGGGSLFYNLNIVTFNNCTLSGNQAEAQGGGISNLNSTLTLKNCTLAGNEANEGGGIYYYYAPKSIAPLKMSDTMILGNLVSARGIYHDDSAIRVALNISNTIIANNTASSNGNDIWSNVVFTSQGYNLIKDTEDSNIVPAATDLIAVDPILGPLASNGGATQTMSLDSISPAINAGNTDLTTDQRGEPRDDGTPDIGAYEYQAPELTPAPAPFNCGATGLEFGVFLLMLALLRKW